jgi:hypothetical protein
MDVTLSTMLAAVAVGRGDASERGGLGIAVAPDC